MTIQRNTLWERPFGNTREQIAVGSLSDAHRTINARRSDLDAVSLDLTHASDVCQTLGISPSEPDAPLFEYPLDLLEITINDQSVLAIGHCSATLPFNHAATFVMNGQRLGEWNLGRKAHPNDGRVDVVSWHGVNVFRWRQIHQRLASGTFVPHPQIVETRGMNYSENFDKPRRLVVDGISYGKTSSIEVAVRGDALIVVA